VADGVLGLRRADGAASYFLVEFDRGHMPNLRRNLDQTSIGRKLALCHEGWKANRHVELFGVKELRVAIVTTSQARVDNMIKAVQDVTGGAGSNLFLFNDIGADCRGGSSCSRLDQWQGRGGETDRLSQCRY